MKILKQEGVLLQHYSIICLYAKCFIVDVICASTSTHRVTESQTHIYKHTHTYIHIHASTHALAHTHTHTHTHTYTHTNIKIVTNTQTDIHTLVSLMWRVFY